MKTGLTKILTLSCVALLALVSCKKNDALITTNGGNPGTLSASATTLPLDRTRLTDTTAAITFTSTPPKYSFSAAATNTLQIDVDGDNWKNPTSVALGTKVYSQSYSTSVFNAMLLKLSLPAGTASKINVRIQYALSSSVITYSNVVSVTVTPFDLSAWVYVVGAFQGWSTSAADSLESATGNGIYTGVIYFTPDNSNPGQNQFLILPAKSYNTKYATAGGADTTGSTPYSYTSEFVSSGGNNFVVKTAGGHYIVTLNANTNTLTLTPSDSYSLIGSAAPGVAWSTDTQLKYVNDGSNDWVLTGVSMSVGEYKFRLDDQWTTSWGPGSAANSAVTSGAVGDGNMPLTTAGNYNLTLVQPPTAYGSANPAPLATTTYTAVKQ